jgi:hypothetical protein
MVQIPKSVFVGFGVGVIMGGALFLPSLLMAFAICSDTALAEKLFPFALIVDPSLFQRPVLALVLSLVQYPLYGIVLGFAWTKARLRIGGVVLLLVIHIAASIVASQRVATMWQQRFSQMNY